MKSIEEKWEEHNSIKFNEGKRIERLGDPKISISPNYNIAA